MKIYTMAEVPDELRQAWLQHLRDFDAVHPGCRFEVLADAPGIAAEVLEAALRGIEPGFPEIRVKRWAKGDE